MNINYIETMKQALTAVLNSTEYRLGHPGYEHTAANLTAAIDAAEKQEPVAWASKSILERLPDFDGTIYARGGFDDATPLYTHPAPTQPDSEQAKIGCIGHDGDCCKDREQVEKDAARYLKLLEECRSSVKFELLTYEKKARAYGNIGPEGEAMHTMAEAEANRLHKLMIAIDAAMKVGAGGTGEGS